MRTMLHYAAVVSLLIPSAGWTIVGEQLNLQPQSKLWVEGGSTIKSWSCEAKDVTANIEASSGGAVAKTLSGEKAISTVDVEMTVEKIECGNGTMNDHLRTALKAKDNKSISFKLTGYDVAKSADGVGGTLNGTLALGGMKKPISIPATGVELGGALRVTGSYTMKMSDYDLTPPSLMFGRIKVRDEVTVKFDLVIKS